MKRILVIALVCFAASANAQLKLRSNTQGLNVSAGGHGLGWASEYFEYLDENAGSGFGGGIRVGYGITQLIEPYINAEFTSLGTSDVDASSFKMSHVDFGVRFNFAGTVSAVRPFVEGGYSMRTGKIDNVIAGFDYVDAKFYGGTPHVGGGLNYFLKPGIALYARGLFTVGKKSNLDINGEKMDEKADVTTFRIGLGVSINLSELIQGN